MIQTWTSGDARVDYVEVRSWGAVRVAAGEPSDGDPATAARFEGDARRAGARVLWFGVEHPHAIADDRPSVVIGAEPVWHPGSWARIKKRKASVRAQLARARNKGVTVAPLPVSEAPGLAPVLTDWLARRGLPPLAFLADPFVLDAPDDRRFWTATRDSRIVGYAVARPGPEVFVEWIIQRRDAPNGTAALLLDAVVACLPPDTAFTLGLVPLSTFAPLSRPAPSRLVRGLLWWTRAHASRFYNFEGLERFKAKFEPDRWRPLHLVTDGAPITVLTFHAVAAAFAAGSPTWFVARALAAAVADEARSAAAAVRERLSSRGSGRSPGSSG
ncbi:phosphatidylglycerol lysyltransferase domain-containing protein [Rubrivirga sp. IMCC45206]|uniref:phosphatidylglycerol lysyltransferase domain-containing protein n=1 Tax=Rubrivirga sp. IMCC45206 TaxID=3391614 RepID=UPI00399011FB